MNFQTKKLKCENNRKNERKKEGSKQIEMISLIKR